MKRQGKKTICMLLILAVLCTLTSLAAADDLPTPDGSISETTGGSTEEVVNIQPAEGSGDAAASGGENVEKTESTEQQVVIIVPEGPGTEGTTDADAAKTENTTTTAETTTEATPTPSPTPAQAAPAANGAKPTVTKHPTDETVDIGGECGNPLHRNSRQTGGLHYWRECPRSRRNHQSTGRPKC